MPTLMFRGGLGRALLSRKNAFFSIHKASVPQVKGIFFTGVIIYPPVMCAF